MFITVIISVSVAESSHHFHRTSAYGHTGYIQGLIYVEKDAMRSLWCGSIGESQHRLCPKMKAIIHLSQTVLGVLLTSVRDVTPNHEKK